MKTHGIKILDKYWDRVNNGQKAFEVRKNDRDYQVGDLIEFRVIMDLDSDMYSIATKEYKIDYMHSGLGIQEGYVVLGISEYSEEALKGDE